MYFLKEYFELSSRAIFVRNLYIKAQHYNDLHFRECYSFGEHVYPLYFSMIFTMFFGYNT